MTTKTSTAAPAKTPTNRIVFLDALSGVSEPWHDLDSEGFPACGR